MTVAVQGVGLVCAVGLSAPSACAAFRAAVNNPSPLRLKDMQGEPIMAHRVPLDAPVAGRRKLVWMAAQAVREALHGIPPTQWASLPMLLCVAEPDRPGNWAGLDDPLFHEIQTELGAAFSAQSASVPLGRVAVAVAVSKARALLQQGAPRVLVVAVDSLLAAPTVRHYERQGRLLLSGQSNGFMPGEGAGALLLGPTSGTAQLVCAGIGFGVERAHIESDEPLRADGLTQAIRQAVAESGTELHELGFRITDLSGEQYYFKEASLALTRTLRQTVPEFDLWHPAEYTGEAGALAGAAMVIWAEAACRKAYAPGRGVLMHMSNDRGERAAMIWHYKGT